MQLYDLNLKTKYFYFLESLPRTNFTLTKKRTTNSSDDQTISYHQPVKISEQNVSFIELPQNQMNDLERNKEMERSLEKFKTFHPRISEHRLNETTIFKPKLSAEESNSNIINYKEWQRKLKNQIFYDTIRSEESNRKIDKFVSSFDNYKTDFENSKLSEKCFSDYKKVKGNLISIDEFVTNLNRYKEENFEDIKLDQISINLNQRIQIPRTLPSVKEAIFCEKPDEILELPLKQLKISSNEYALNKDESEKIKKNLPLFYNLLFKDEEFEGKQIADGTKEKIVTYTGTIKSELFLFNTL